MQPVKAAVSNIAASATSGMEKSKALAEEKMEKLRTSDPLQKEMATQKKEDRIAQAEFEKQQTYQQNQAAKDSATYSTTGAQGHPTGTHQMSAVPGHGTGHPVGGHVTEGTVGSHPIGVTTGTGRTLAHNTRAGGAGGGTGGGGAAYDGTGGGYTG